MNTKNIFIGNDDFEKFVSRNSCKGIFAGATSRAALSVVFHRPIISLSKGSYKNFDYISDPTCSKDIPLVIAYNEDFKHYVSVLFRDSSSKIRTELINQEQNMEPP